MPDILNIQSPGRTPEAPHPWQDDALCVDVDPEMFFPKVGDIKTSQAAREFCQACPVIAECLNLGKGYEFGIFGGMTSNERRKVDNVPPRRNGSTARQLEMHRRGTPVSEIAKLCHVTERTVFRTIAGAA